MTDAKTWPKTWVGGCHCGDVRYEVTSALDSLISCNCSICEKRGLILAFVPQSDFRLIEGDNAQTDYQFNTKKIHHLFCKRCGVESFGTGAKPDGTPMVAINVRCLDGIDLASLNPKSIDGRSF